MQDDRKAAGTRKFEPTRYPGVFRRGEKYVYFYRLGGKQKMASGFRTAAQADKDKKRRETEISDGQFLEESRERFVAYLLEWVVSYRGRGRRGFRESTREDYKRAIELYIAPYFRGELGNPTIGQVTPRMLNRFVDWLCDPVAMAALAHERAVAAARAAGKPAPARKRGEHVLSDSRIRNVIAPIRSAMATAVREGIVRFNPADRIELPNREHLQIEDDETIIRAFTTEQLRVVLTHVDDEWRLFFRLLASTGLRWGEIVALQWDHLVLDVVDPYVKVRRRLYRGTYARPKSKYGRRDVPLERKLAVELRELWIALGQPASDELVWQTTTGSALDHSNMLRRVLRPAAKIAGAEWAGFHTFRHTCATMLFARGRNAVQVQRWLGHHSPAFTLSRYVHLLDDDLGRALELGALGDQPELWEPGTQVANGMANNAHSTQPTQPNGRRQLRAV